MKKHKKSLRQLYDEHLDKVSDRWESYLSVYDEILTEYREKPIRMLEIGVQNGGGLEIWAKYFINGSVFVGCDIDSKCSQLGFSDPRIKLVIGNVNEETTHKEIIFHSPVFDIVIDDGSHLSADMIKSFLLYFPKVVNGGIYVVEDLHVSYWDEYQGGLFHPYSSISFFKWLVDIINSDHWGVERRGLDILSGFAQEYGIEIKDEIFQFVHSIEFRNSLCIIRKSNPVNNELGQRIISGEIAEVSPDIMEHKGSMLISPLQTENVWSTRERPPGEEITKREQELRTLNDNVNNLEEQLQNLSSQIEEREQQIEGLKHDLNDRDRHIHELTRNLQEYTEQVKVLSKKVEKQEQKVQLLSNEIIDREEQEQNLSNQVQRLRTQNIKITNSQVWRIAKKLQRARDLIIPTGSVRALLAKKILSIVFFPIVLQQRRKIGLIRDSEYFNQDWYLAHNPDVALVGADPAHHYLEYGGFEGRDPGPKFSSRWYLDVYSDVADAGVNPLLHYLKFGKHEAREIRGSKMAREKRVGIVIVSHNASLAVRITLAGLRHAKNNTPYQLILVDNGSVQSERDVIHQAFVKHVTEANLPWRYLQLENNLGFAAGNNVGIETLMRDESVSHICMLNSDVIVPDYWLDRLIKEGCEMVSPVTNKADSVQSVPADYELSLSSCLDAAREVIQYDALEKVNRFAHDWFQAWRGNMICMEEDVTFFCVLFTRELVQRVGLLDTKFFPGGFEDFDYCARLLAKGYEIWLAREVYIHHWGSASFGELSREYFNENALRNKKYLEEKHNIEWKSQPQAPIISFAQDVSYALKGCGDHDLQLRFLRLYSEALSKLLEHHDKEFRALRNLVKDSGRELPQSMHLDIVHLTDEDDLAQNWHDLMQRIFEKMEIVPINSNDFDLVMHELDQMADAVYAKATCNIAMSEFLYGEYHKRDDDSPSPPSNRLAGIIWEIRKGIALIWKLKGIVFFSGYPYPEREKDGYFQRIRTVDNIFPEYWRIYVDQINRSSTDRWFDIPAMRTLVLRINTNGIKKWIARLCALLCVVRSRKIYFHSVLPMDGSGWLFRLPGITKVIDIHGVVPEEFRFENDEYHAGIFEKYEELAIKKADLIIVVSDAMRRHLLKKYKRSGRGEFLILPIVPGIDAGMSRKNYTNGKPLIVYVGGLQKWQQVPKMIDAICSTADKYIYKFLSPRPELVRTMFNEKSCPMEQIYVDSKPYSELMQVYEECHYGFILRENIIVNHVACPTKLVEYLATGIIPIVECKDIGDFKSLGMQSVQFEDLLAGKLPDESTRNQMAEANFKIYENLRDQYSFGVDLLKRTLDYQKRSQQGRSRKFAEGVKDWVQLLLPRESLRGNIARRCWQTIKPEAKAHEREIDAGISDRDFRLTPSESTSGFLPQSDILVQVDNFLAGGLENAVLNINEAFIKAGWKVSLLVLGAPGSAVERARRTGMPVLVTRFDPGSYEQLLEKVSPKLMFGHYSFEGSDIRGELGIPLIQVIHDTYMWFNKHQLREFRHATQHTLAFIVPSQCVETYSVSKLGIPSERCWIIPHGVDIHKIRNLDFTAERSRLRAKHYFSDDDFIFLNVSAIIHKKNHMGAVRAFHAALPECPHAKYVILGPNYEVQLLEEVKEYIQEHEIESHVIYAGEVVEAYAYYAMADSLVCASFFEAGPLVLLEALASNLPIVTTNVGFAALFKNLDGVTIIPPPIDIFSYKGKIWELQSNDEFEQNLKEEMIGIYQRPIKPNLPDSVIESMDKSHAYNIYVNLVKRFFETGEIPRDISISSWPSKLLGGKDV